MKRIKRGTVMLSVLAILLFGSMETKAAGTADTILNGVHIGSVDVSGMTADQAKTAVEQFVSDSMDDIITFHMQDETYGTSVGSLNYAWVNEDVVNEAVSYGKKGIL